MIQNNTPDENTRHPDIPLLPRLKFMGYMLYGFACITLSVAIFAPKSDSIYTELAQDNVVTPQEMEEGSGLSLLIEDESLLELDPREVFNFFYVSALFAVVGTSCFWLFYKKKKNLQV
ncbi:MAG: hypothetical protein C5B45_01440 [Chlamydiae bacterium]|nr:MAG: hypothetical protein C5B45_01440 [Chlamydiota bacterium]